MLCSLTGNIMKHPVDGNDGYTYEQIQILYWLLKNNISPKTGENMQLTDLKINIFARNQYIETFKKRNMFINLKSKIKYYINYFSISLRRSFLKLTG
jgi:hypothetical protein